MSIIIQQTAKPLGSGSNTVKITDSAGADLLSNGTNALQVDQAGLITALTAILNALTSGTNSGTLTDTSRQQTLTGSAAALAAEPCKKVTLINLSTNTANITYTVNGGANNILEPGYSAQFNVSDANLITITSTVAEKAYYIVSA